MSKYGFFDSKYVLMDKGYRGSDKLSIQQFIVMGLIFIAIVAISILLRKVKKEKIFTIYKVLSIVMPIGEILKISIETHLDLAHGDAFNLGGLLPLYACSMLLYFLPFVAWGKGGKMQRWSMAFFVSIGLVAGLSNFVYLSAAGWYPLATLGCLYSIIFHAVIVFVGMSLMITGIYKPSFKTIYEGMIPVLMFSVIVIPANYIIASLKFDIGSFPDYMMLMNCNGFIPKISDWFANHHIRILFTFIVLLVAYPIATTLITIIDLGIGKIFESVFKNKKEKSTT